MTSSRRRILGRAAAGLTGLLSVAAALAAGHLVAGILGDPSASPYLAVGNAAIDRTPNPVKEFAVEHFGTSDIHTGSSAGGTTTPRGSSDQDAVADRRTG